MTDQINFSIIEEAGLSQGEFAEVCQVTRCTVNLWVNGKMRPHKYLRPQVEQAIDKIKLAVAEGKLPLPAHIRPGKVRTKEVLTAVGEMTN